MVGSPRPQERGVAAEVKVGVAAEVKGGVAAEVMGVAAEVMGDVGEAGAVGTLLHPLLVVKGSPSSLGQQISKVITIGFKYYKVTKNQTLSFLGIAINLITWHNSKSRKHITTKMKIKSKNTNRNVSRPSVHFSEKLPLFAYNKRKK